jgi:hypothetical protein
MYLNAISNLKPEKSKFSTYCCKANLLIGALSYFLGTVANTQISYTYWPPNHSAIFSRAKKPSSSSQQREASSFARFSISPPSSIVKEYALGLCDVWDANRLRVRSFTVNSCAAVPEAGTG